MERRRIELGGGLGLEVLEAGAPGARPLMLVHGFTGAKEDFADHLDALAASGWHVVAPDLRGHGASDRPPGGESYGLRRFAADLVHLAGALGWARFTLLGHSMGGMAAQHLAIDAPDRLEGLVLMGTSHSVPDGIDPVVVELGKAVVRSGGMGLLVEAARPPAGPLGTPAHDRVVRQRAGYREFSERKTLSASADMWLAMVDELLAQPDRLADLAAVEVPTLVLVGEQDRSFLAHSRRIAAAMPRARLVVVPDAGHSPQFENPRAWFEALSAFLDDLAASDPH